jgi:hypothetical protein
MTEVQTEDNFDDEAHDAQYFNLIFELANKNSSRYELQTEKILKKGYLLVEFCGATIEFKVTPTGCSFSISDDASARRSRSWLRMGWRKSAKRRSLPNYFAQAEASVLINRGS